MIANTEHTACQVATCDAMKGVVLTNKVCPAAAPCTKSFCDAARGCVAEPIVCPTATDSSTWVCSKETNQCINIPPNCDDGNACTDDKFIAGQGCQHTPHCVAPNACTTTTCSNGNCINTPVCCDDGNACTTDSCNLETGKCQNTLITCSAAADQIGTCDQQSGLCQIRKRCTVCAECDDNDPTTQDTCTPTGCTNVPLPAAAY